MATKQAETKKPKEMGKFGRWMLRRVNARANRKIRGGRDRLMGMEVLVLTTVGKRSGQRRETPLARFADGAGGWFVLASGGQGGRYPDWYSNLLANPDQARIELPGRPATAVAVRRLAGAEREQAWREISTSQPRLAKYQAKSARPYPVVNLTPR